MKVYDLAIIERQRRLEKVYQDHSVVVSVASLPFTVCVPPTAVECHPDSPLPLWPEESVGTRAVNLLYHTLPGLLPGAQGSWEWEVEGEVAHGED